MKNNKLIKTINNYKLICKLVEEKLKLLYNLDPYYQDIITVLSVDICGKYIFVNYTNKYSKIYIKKIPLKILSTNNYHELEKLVHKFYLKRRQKSIM